MHAVDRYLRFCSMLDLMQDGVDFSFAVSEDSVARVTRLLDRHFGGIGNAGLAVIAPGTVWETKHWSSAGFARIARYLMRKNIAVVLIGSNGERAVCWEVANMAPGAVNFAGATSLGELAALIRRATICVTNDSGPMHLAVALDRPVVSIFGPTDPLWIGPYQRPDAVVSAAVSCSPCYLRQLNRCPHGHACMRGISAGAVIERIEATLAGRDDCSAASDEGQHGPAGAGCLG
jgi:ADP-heptose:LPS heptosyltransferase